MDTDNGRYRYHTVDVRKQLGAAREIFVHDATAESRRINFQEHQIALSVKQPIRDADDLRTVGTVDESFPRERLRPTL